jgi:outer membrane protein OmpA-like peptidoglycan-associated protein
MRKALSIIAAAVLVATSAAAAERHGFYIGGDLGQSNWDVFSKSDANAIASAFEDFGVVLYPGADGLDVTSQKTSLEDTDFTYSLFVGYQFLPWLAAEATWMDLGQTSIKGSGDFDYLYNNEPPLGAPIGGTFDARVDIQSSGWAVSVLPMWPIGDSWDLYGRLGYYWGDNKLDVKATAEDFDLIGPYDSYGGKLHDSNNDGGFLWGLGAQWTWDQRVSVRLEFSQIVDLIDLGGSKSSVDRYTLGMAYRFGHKEEAAPVVAAAPVAAAPVVAAKCADSDKDGVCDTADKCPNTPAGERVGPAGCSCDITLRTHFAFDSAELTAEDKAALDKAAARLKELNFVEGTATGHTDSVGEEAYNQKLSERRAQAVVDYLAAQGVAPGRIKAIGMGEAKPIATNETEAGRAENRRVTIRRTDCGPAN